ncbi:MAG: hypothetical protein KIT60_23290 [Burkholderiaceae bacterium]|nr:hypothetical protein [Burkholderiaceae bacterium]
MEMPNFHQAPKKSADGKKNGLEESAHFVSPAKVGFYSCKTHTGKVRARPALTDARMAALENSRSGRPTWDSSPASAC